MTDVWHKLMKFLDYERWKVIGFVTAMIIGFSIVGCDLKISNPYDPQGDKINATEFRLLSTNAEVSLKQELAEYDAWGITLQAKATAHDQNTQAGKEEFVEKQEFQVKVINFIGGLATTLLTGGTANPASIITSLITLAAVGTGLGAIKDKRNGNKVIADLKADTT